MAFWICIGTLAAFGLFCVFWSLLGWLLPKTGGSLLCLDEGDVYVLVRRYLWLRGLGLLEYPLIVLDRDLPEPERDWLEKNGIEIWGPAELSARLGIGAEEFDGTGNGDPPGNHQCGGISEL